MHEEVGATKMKLLPQEVVDFYDPNAVFEGSQGRLVDVMLHRPPARGLEGWSLVLAELQSSGASESTWLAVAQQADMSEEKATQVNEWVVAQAETTTRQALGRVAGLRHVMGGETHDVVLAAAVLSANSHRHDSDRLSGGPYYNHPKAVAKIIEIAWTHHLDDRPGLDLQLKQSLGLLHDAWENMFSKSALSFMADERMLVTPFSYGHMLGKLGVSTAEAWQGTCDLRRVTKQPDVTGAPQDYAIYIHGGGWQENAATAKIADIHHNSVIDRKPLVLNAEKSRKIHAKYNQYWDSYSHILSVVETEADFFRVGLMLERLKLVTKEELSNTPSVLDQIGVSDLRV